MKARRYPSTMETYAVEIDRDDASGVAVFEEWRKDGIQHRLDGPGQILRHRSTGIVVEERWTRNGQLHREDGPAVILRNAATGHVYHSVWCQNGVKVKAPKPVRGPPRRRRAPSSPAGPAA